MKDGCYLDCSEERNIICPYCYEVVDDWDYQVANRADTDYVDVSCPYCGKDFKCYAETTIKYTSVRVDDSNIIIDDWWDEE
jgi:sarcosine oxidase delta subunit